MGSLLQREWRRDDGAVMRIGRCLIDANCGASTDVVKQFCRQSTHSAVLMPSHGRFVGASSMQFDEYRRKAGDRLGHHWRIPSASGHANVRHVAFDTNYWKSFTQARLAVAHGDRGCLSLFAGKDHRMLADHLTSELRVNVTAKGRSVDEWRLRSPGRDNHWLDCLVGCAVGASMLGVSLQEASAKPVERKRVRFSELQARAHRYTAESWRRRHSGGHVDGESF